MRYELDTPFSEVANRWASFDPKTATVLIAGRNGVGKSAGVNTFKKGFAPRLGFAYQAADKTVVRGGAGIFWNTAGHGRQRTAPHTTRSIRTDLQFLAGNFFVTRRVSDSFPVLPALNLASADNPSGSVIGCRSELSARIRDAVQPDGRGRSCRPRSCSKPRMSATLGAISTRAITSIRRYPGRERSATGVPSSGCDRRWPM
jgi:hypothetical protein